MSTRSNAAALTLAAFAALAPATPSTASGGPRTGYDVLEPACGGPTRPGRATCFAVAARPSPAAGPRRAGGLPARAQPYTAGAGALSTGPAGGLTPADLAKAYSYDPSGGAGQTVAVVDAYDDPTIEGDLKVFDKQYGLGECTHAGGCFRKVNQSGHEGEPPAEDTTGWSAEIALDVETVRAACHGCSILLVEASNGTYEDLAKAVNEAVSLGADEVTNSYGGPESGMHASERAAYDHPGTVITAASGDLGWDDFAVDLPPYDNPPPAMPDAPASLPTVVAVGGTTLSLDGEGGWRGETVWDDEAHEGGRLVGGGGCSTLFAAQPWQLDATGFAAAGCEGRRLEADIGADGDPLTGFDVYDSFDYCKAPGAKCSAARERALSEAGGWQKYGGTSLSTPLVTALYALSGGAHGLAYPALSLYGHLGDTGDLHDVTSGGNGWCAGEPASVCGHPNAASGLTLDCEETTACDATVGLDGPSGVGTPDGLGAFAPAPPVAAILAPSVRIVAGAPASFSAAPSSDPNPGAVMDGWSWNWGAGVEPAGETAQHTFAAPGEYEVQLVVADSYGLRSAPRATRVDVISRQQAEVEEREEEATRRRRVEEEARRAAEASVQTAGFGGASVPSPELGVSAFTQASSARAGLAAVARVVVGRGGRFALKLTCSQGSGSCSGSVVVRLLVVGGPSRRRSGPSILASARFALHAGTTASVALGLSRTGAILLGRHGLRVRILLTGQGSASAGRIATLVLRPTPRRRSRA